MSYFRDNIEAMTGYVPGEQPPPGAKVIKLNTNENPYPPSAAVMDVLREMDGDALRRYPDPTAERVRLAVGEALDVSAEGVLVGNGSDDLLGMIFKGCCQPGRGVVYPVPTYVYYRTLADVQDAPHTEIAFDEDYNLPSESLIAADGAVTLIASPNSPSGTLAATDALDALAGRLSGLLVIDEAYTDFAVENALPLAKRHENVIILRTLSKGYSLAGLRVGFAVGSPGVLATLGKVRDHYNVGAVPCAVAAAGLCDQSHMRANAEKIKASRSKLTAALQSLGWKVWASQANFVLARPGDGQAERTYQDLKARRILVRYFKETALDDKLRITVGTPEQNRALIDALKEMQKMDAR